MRSSAIPDPRLWVTILAGGSGTRFWPASTPARPKQLLPLAGGEPLIKETLERARLLAPDERIRILAGSHLLHSLREALGALPDSSCLVEPEPRGTGPALVWAAWTLSRHDPEAVLVSLHADHAIGPPSAFRELLLDGAALARSQDLLFTVAVPATRPETGYGYIRPGEALAAGGGAEAFRVMAFVEKPDREAAGRYVEAGYLWNSGIFLWKASTFLEEVRAVAPELAGLLPLLEAGDVEGFFRKAPLLSVDEAVLERSRRVAFLRATFRWDDVGGWEALRRTREGDEEGNVALGSAHLVDSTGNVVWSEDGEVVLYGVHDLVVVRSGRITLVADRARAPELKTLLRTLPPHLGDPGTP